MVVAGPLSALAESDVASKVFPPVLERAGRAACFAADEFFSARISNPETRRAYARATPISAPMSRLSSSRPGPNRSGRCRTVAIFPSRNTRSLRATPAENPSMDRISATYRIGFWILGSGLDHKEKSPTGLRTLAVGNVQGRQPIARFLDFLSSRLNLP